MAFDGVLEYVSCIAMVMFLWFHLCRIIEKTISPAYDKICQMYYKIPRSTDAHMMDASPVSLPKEFFQMLAACGPYLHRDTQLFQKVPSNLLLLICLVLVPAHYHDILDASILCMTGDFLQCIYVIYY